MSKVVRVQDGDYKVVVGSSITPGNIILDTNPAGEFGTQGEVRITGDLIVLGNITAVQSETLTVNDNIIELNKGETGNGVSTLGTTSGIRVNRGTRPYVEFVWDESLLSRNPLTGVNTPGTFKFTTLSDQLIPIATNSINTDGGDLALISSGDGVITVTGTTDYEQRILDYANLNLLFDIISIQRQSNVAIIQVNGIHGLQNGIRVDVVCFPNSTLNTSSAFITVVNDTTISYTNNGPDIPLTALPLGTGGTVKPNAIIDDDRIPNMRAVADYATASLTSFISKKIQEQDTKVEISDNGTADSEIVFTVDSNSRAVINNTGLSVDNINIFGNIISNFLNDNLRVDSVLSLENKITDPIVTPGYVTLYSKSDPGNGGSGVYFVNTAGTDDELISKTRALLYSLIL